jgi:ribonuclease D
MTPFTLPPAQHIVTSADLQALVSQLAHTTPVVGIDTESNNLYAYQGRVCLIQLSTSTQDYIIDPILIDDMSPFGTLLADERIEKVFHGAEYDLACIKRDYHFVIRNVFDTMYASRMISGQMVSLAELLSTHFQVHADKSHQLDNWGVRPLPTDSLRYAQMDTHFLPQLHTLFLQSLSELEMLAEAREIFADIALMDTKDQFFDPEGYWKLFKPHELNKRQIAVLAELYQVRDELAREEDLPPTKLIENKLLIELAINAPTNRRELSQLHLRPQTIRLYADDLLDAIERGQKNKPPKQPPTHRVAQPIADRYVALHAWRKEIGIQRNIESNMVMTKQVLWNIAHACPFSTDELAKIDGIGAWRLAHYGAGILEVMQHFNK